MEAASKKGIIVMNAPTGNTLAATELTMGIMLAAARKIPLANNSLKEGKWDRKRFMGIQLYNKILGIVGLGRIGSAVAIRAKSFGMKVIAYDPYIKKSKADSLGVILYDKLEDLLRVVDIITFHTPLPAARNMIKAKEIALMKDNVIFVNCARGGIVNEADLYDALKAGKVFAPGLMYGRKSPLKATNFSNLKMPSQRHTSGRIPWRAGGSGAYYLQPGSERTPWKALRERCKLYRLCCPRCLRICSFILISLKKWESLRLRW